MQPNLLLGARRVVRPGKVEAMLNRRKDLPRYQLYVNLHASAIVGPFSFMQVRTQSGLDNNRIADEHWDTLLRLAPGRGVDALSVDQQPQRQARQRQGTIMLAMPPSANVEHQPSRGSDTCMTQGHMHGWHTGRSLRDSDEDPAHRLHRNDAAQLGTRDPHGLSDRGGQPSCSGGTARITGRDAGRSHRGGGGCEPPPMRVLPNPCWASATYTDRCSKKSLGFVQRTPPIFDGGGGDEAQGL